MIRQAPKKAKLELIHDRGALVAALRKLGIEYLAPGDAAAKRSVTDECLLASLASHEDPRLRQALIAVFLLHTRVASLVPGLREGLGEPAATELVAHYMAAVYLQRMWRIRLGHYFEEVSELPDHFARDLGLPAPEEGHGKAGLHALAEWHAERSRRRANRLSEYQGAADLLFQSLRLKRARHEPPPKR